MSAASHSIRLTVWIVPAASALSTGAGTSLIRRAPFRAVSVDLIKNNIIEVCSHFNFNTGSSMARRGPAMPIPQQVSYVFTPKEVVGITGISLHMLNYLSRMGYLQPAYP